MCNKWYIIQKKNQPNLSAHEYINNEMNNGKHVFELIFYIVSAFIPKGILSMVAYWCMVLGIYALTFQ